MNYFVDIKFLQDTFPIPKVIIEKHLKIATPTQLKVLLYVLSHLAEDPSDEQIALFLSADESDISDALKYWETAGILISKNPNPITTYSETPTKKIIKKEIVKPSRAEVIERGTQNEELKLLLSEAELKFGRELRFTEISTFVWLFDEQGMDISLILMLIEFAKTENRLNIGFIERTAINWLNNGIDSIGKADNHITDMTEKRTAWKIVETTFGIDSRLPSAKELEYAKLWINEWGFSREILKAAYERCVDSKSKFIMSYTAKILEGWHKMGFTSLKQIEEDETARKKTSYDSMVTYDINELEKLINK